MNIRAESLVLTEFRPLQTPALPCHGVIIPSIHGHHLACHVHCSEVGGLSILEARPRPKLPLSLKVARIFVCNYDISGPSLNGGGRSALAWNDPTISFLTAHYPLLDPWSGWHDEVMSINSSIYTCRETTNLSSTHTNIF